MDPGLLALAAVLHQRARVPQLSNQGLIRVSMGIVGGGASSSGHADAAVAFATSTLTDHELGFIRRLAVLRLRGNAMGKSVMGALSAAKAAGAGYWRQPH